MAPRFTAAARLLKLNADADPQASAELGVSGISALILFQDGREIARRAGAQTADQIIAWTRLALSQAASA